MKKVFYLAVLLITVFISCTDQDDNVNMVNIRVQNSTEQFFTEVRIAQRDTVYENIEAGGISEYQEFEAAFQAMAVTVLTDSTSFNYFPDEVQSDSLPIGFYTYELSLNEEEQLELTFKIDQ